jgi:HSP20 family protein
MNRIALSNPSVPETFQSMFRQMAQPWRMDETFFDLMFKPRYSKFEPMFNQSLDAFARRLADSWRIRESLFGGMDVNVDVVEKNGTYRVRADLPGMKKEDINVRIDGNIVNIEAHTQEANETTDGDGKLLFNERYSGTVSRTFTLGQEVDEAKASGKYADGVLTLELPKKAGLAKQEIKPIAIH